MVLESPRIAAKARILVVDDDATIRKVVSLILVQEGYLVDTAQDAEEAISKSNANFYNLVLIDVHLPDMDGTKLLTLLRDTSPKMAKVIVTGYPVLENALEAINRGVDGYLTKPVNSETLLKTVKEQLRKQEKNKQFTEESLMEYVGTRFKQAKTIRREIYHE